MKDVRDPKFTARCEEALRLLARRSLPLAYLTNRFGLESGDLALWLGEFNAGSKVLKLERVDQVKAELGAVRVVRLEKASPSAVVHSAPNPVPPAAGKSIAAAAVSPALDAPTAAIGEWLQQQRAEIVGRVNCFQVRVTPALAEAWLKFNRGNRSPSRAKIRRFAAAMAAGKWALNGETLKFSVSGRLIDGQSRLMAIVLAGVPVVLEVRAALPDGAQQSMDSGELRKGAHMLEMLGEANPVVLAAALKLVWIWRRGWLGGFAFGCSRVMENGEVGPLLAESAALKSSAGWVISDGAKADRLMPRSEGAFFHWLFGLADTAARDAFFEALCEGVGLTKFSPVYHLRERLLAERGGTDNEQRKILRRALVIKAWNAAQAGEKMSTLAWREGEAFPEVAGVPTPETQKGPGRVSDRKGGAA